MVIDVNHKWEIAESWGVLGIIKNDHWQPIFYISEIILIWIRTKKRNCKIYNKMCFLVVFMAKVNSYSWANNVYQNNKVKVRKSSPFHLVPRSLLPEETIIKYFLSFWKTLMYMQSYICIMCECVYRLFIFLILYMLFCILAWF